MNFQELATPAVFTTLVFTLLTGACVGSFLNVCIYRIPLELSVVKPRSFCPACKTPIPFWWNIPLLSWVLLGGKCRACRARISPRYFFVEALAALLFGMVFLQWDALPSMLGMVQRDAAQLPVFMAFAASLVCASFIDIDHYILPDRITIGGTVAGLALSALLPQLHNAPSWLAGLGRSALGAGCGFAALWLVAVLGKLVFKKDAMGFGDVKLMAMFGAFFGWQSLPFVLFLGSLAGSLVGVFLILTGRRERSGIIPFGPFLCAGALAWMFWGPVLLDMYAGLVKL
ncbi:MAG: prepilin peptidase [Kiritimatiellaeota bacterium]|nr:prepilin peptidase [Kiritimatiellota bacterium]